MDGQMEFMWSEGKGSSILPESGKCSQTLLILCHPEGPRQYLANGELKHLAAFNPACLGILTLHHPQEGRKFYPQGCLALLPNLLATFTPTLLAFVSSFVKWR